MVFRRVLVFIFLVFSVCLLSAQYTVSLQPTDELSAGEGALRVLIESQGKERQIGFSVAFDPAVLTWIRGDPGSDVAASWLTVDTSLAATGHIGVLVTPPAGTTLAAGTREIARLGFRALVAGPITTAVTFSGPPLVQFISFSGAASTLTFVEREITVGTLPASPLFLSPAATNFSVGLLGQFFVRAAAAPAAVYAVSAGALPAWVTLDAATGRLSGVPPSVPDSPFVFSLRATNGTGPAATQVFTLRVDPAPIAPAIAVPPRSLAALPGEAVAFAPVVSGSPPLVFQWKRDGVPIVAATDAVLALARVGAADGGNYSVDVTNVAGVATSPPAALVLGTAGVVRAGDFGMPLLSVSSVFSSQFIGARLRLPTATKLAGVTTEFSHVSGSLFLAVVILATDTSLPGGGGTSTTPFNSGEVVFHTTFTLPPDFAGIAAVPLDLDLAPGVYGFVIGSGQFGATGSAGVTNYAYKNDQAGFIWNGPPGGVFRWSNTSFQRRIAVVTTETAAVGPVVILAPAPITASLGAKVAFAVVATGTAPLAYQWKKHGVAIGGATASTFFLNGVQSADAANYEVSVSNYGGSITSRAVPLSVGAVRPLELTLVRPALGSVAVAQVAQPLVAVASSSLAAIAAVQFFADNVAVGSPVTVPPYTTDWTPPRRASAVLTARVADAVGRTMEAFPVLVNISAAPTFASPADARFIVGRPGAFTLSAAGIPAPTITVSGLPTWASIDVATGALTGTPPSSSGSPFTFTLTAANGIGTPVTQTFTLTVQVGHSADVSPADGTLNLAELTRVIELYNTRTGTLRTGRYAASASTTDGFTPEPTVTAGPIPVPPHSADTNRDGYLTLTELTRVIELYNVRAGTLRTGVYRVQAGSEDGFAPGP